MSDSNVGVRDLLSEFNEMVGSREFETYDEFAAALADFTSSTNTYYVCRRSKLIENDPAARFDMPLCLKYVKATYNCVHYPRKYESSVRGPRHKNFGCSSKFMVYADNCRLKVREIKMKHNHFPKDEDPFFYKRNRINLGEEELEEVYEIMRRVKSNVKVRQYFVERFNRTITIRDVYHLREKLRRKDLCGGDTSEPPDVSVLDVSNIEEENSGTEEPQNSSSDEASAGDGFVSESLQLCADMLGVLKSLEPSERFQQCTYIREWITCLQTNGHASVRLVAEPKRFNVGTQTESIVVSRNQLPPEPKRKWTLDSLEDCATKRLFLTKAQKPDNSREVGSTELRNTPRPINCTGVRPVKKHRFFRFRF
ncbi:unnamed protein product [Calicophoron daubneyi]|uniref:FAR1 domain-containing protein n=1 Tax=Calicophoron daubneyi TaxID=300641 RepID=A0AAV2TSB2_CALDB